MRLAGSKKPYHNYYMACVGLAPGSRKYRLSPSHEGTSLFYFKNCLVQTNRIHRHVQRWRGTSVVYNRSNNVLMSWPVWGSEASPKEKKKETVVVHEGTFLLRFSKECLVLWKITIFGPMEGDAGRPKVPYHSAHGLFGLGTGTERKT